jgi:hypothetical protein
MGVTGIGPIVAEEQAAACTMDERIGYSIVHELEADVPPTYTHLIHVDGGPSDWRWWVAEIVDEQTEPSVYFTKAWVAWEMEKESETPGEAGMTRRSSLPWG